MPTFYDPS